MQHRMKVFKRMTMETRVETAIDCSVVLPCELNKSRKEKTNRYRDDSLQPLTVSVVNTRSRTKPHGHHIPSTFRGSKGMKLVGQSHNIRVTDSRTMMATITSRSHMRDLIG